jgi:hypothetical protein
MIHLIILSPISASVGALTTALLFQLELGRRTRRLSNLYFLIFYASLAAFVSTVVLGVDKPLHAFFIGLALDVILQTSRNQTRSFVKNCLNF